MEKNIFDNSLDHISFLIKEIQTFFFIFTPVYFSASSLTHLQQFSSIKKVQNTFGFVVTLKLLNFSYQQYCFIRINSKNMSMNQKMLKTFCLIIDKYLYLEKGTRLNLRDRKGNFLAMLMLNQILTA